MKKATENKGLVGFDDLKPELKVFVILGWVVILLYGLAFLIGFIMGFMGV